MPVTLTWACTDEGKQDVYRVYSDTWQAVDCINDGKCLTWQDGLTGVETPALSQTTVFSLDVVKDDGAGHRSIAGTLHTTVVLAVPSVSELSHLNQYFSSQAVSLHWLAYNAGHCAVTVNGVTVVDKAPVDTYQQGYPLTLQGNHHTYQVSVLAYAATGPAYATHTLPDVKVGPRLTIPAGPGPSAVALTPDGALALVLNPSSHQMTFVNVAARQPEPTPVTLPRSPWSIAVTPDGTLALVPVPLAGMYIVKVPARQVDPRDYAMGFSPVRMAITPDGKLAFAADPQGPSSGPDPLGGGVWIFDMAARSLDVHHAIENIPSPYLMAITPDGALALVTNQKGHSVTVIDVAQRVAEPKTIPVGNTPQGIAITPDGKLALVVNSQDGSLTVIDIPARTAEPKTIPVGAGPDTVAITPNGRMALVGNARDNTVAVVDVAARSVIGTVPVSGLPAQGGQSLVVMPDGSGALVLNVSGNSLSLI
jgi:YVTN family beta-propeller protein